MLENIPCQNCVVRSRGVEWREVSTPGGWAVDIIETEFGDRIAHGLDGERVMLMGLPRLAGWRGISPVCGPDQVYVEKVMRWLNAHTRAREVAVLDPDSGTWQTVWQQEVHSSGE
jgi:hypothetical protein